MKNKLVILGLLLSMSSFGQLYTPADPHWQQTWFDNFKTMTEGQIRAGWAFAHNFHFQTAAPEINLDSNIRLNSTNGMEIYLKREEYSHGGTDYHYTGGSVSSYIGVPGYDREIQYGYIQADIKLTDHYGAWPAFWLWSKDTVTDEEEIDIFENIPGTLEQHTSSPFYGAIKDENYVSSNVHTTGGGAMGDLGEAFPMSDFTNLHTYALEWTPTALIFYVDNVIVRYLPNPAITQKASIILNVAIFPWMHCQTPLMPVDSCLIYDLDWDQTTAEDYFDPPSGPAYPGGPSYPSFSNINSSNAKMYVNNVVYYELNQSCPITTDFSASPINWASYTYAVKRSITVTGSVPSSTSKTLRATDYILLNDVFEVPIGSELYLDVNPCY